MRNTHLKMRNWHARSAPDQPIEKPHYWGFAPYFDIWLGRIGFTLPQARKILEFTVLFTFTVSQVLEPGGNVWCKTSVQKSGEKRRCWVLQKLIVVFSQCQSLVQNVGAESNVFCKGLVQMFGAEFHDPKTWYLIFIRQKSGARTNILRLYKITLWYLNAYVKRWCNFRCNGFFQKCGAKVLW